MQTFLRCCAVLSLGIGSPSLTAATAYRAEQLSIPRYPHRIPPVLVERLNSDIVRLLEMRNVRERLANEGNEPAPGAPAEFGAFLRRDLAKWAKIAPTMKMTAG